MGDFLSKKRVGVFTFGKPYLQHSIVDGRAKVDRLRQVYELQNCLSCEFNAPKDGVDGRILTNTLKPSVSSSGDRFDEPVSSRSLNHSLSMFSNSGNSL